MKLINSKFTNLDLIDHKILLFFKSLAICHQVQININENNEIIDKLNDIISKTGGNKFNSNSIFDNFSSYINEFSDFLKNITLEQKFALNRYG